MVTQHLKDDDGMPGLMRTVEGDDDDDDGDCEDDDDDVGGGGGAAVAAVCASAYSVRTLPSAHSAVGDRVHG